MPPIDDLRKKRFQYLNLLYEKSGGDKFNRIGMWDLGNALGFTREETQSITQYLEGEGLMEYVTLNGGIAITHYGVREVEEAISHPEQPSHYFPPLNIINIHHMENSQIQQGTIASSQTGTFQIINKGNIGEFIKQLKGRVPELLLATEDEQEINSDISTIESQISSSRPKSGIIKECLSSIQRILEGAGGAVVAQQLIPYIPVLLATLK